MLAPVRISSDATARTRRGCRALETRFGHLEGTGRTRRAVASCPELHAAGIPPGAAIRVRDPPDSESQNWRQKSAFYNLSHYAPISLRGAPTSRMGMTTVWRPRVRIDVPDVGDAENTDTSREELTTRGTKRKIAPKHHGPCEHGVKHRSNCKVCSACPHGRQRSQCKECGGSSICEHGRQRHNARSAVGHKSASTVVGALGARSAVGHQSASTVVCALGARSAVVHQSASMVVGALSARSAWGINLRARSSAHSVQGVRWVCNLRARSSALLMQGVRWVRNLRARSCAL